MPIANFKCVREVSSEDNNYSARNLLKQESGKKWKTKSEGEKSAYVILELNKPTQITGIDIGNEHSAFVEVLVSCSGCRSEDFTEILITCSFMTPIESKNSSNLNRVRCFNQDALVPSAACKKWHLIKIICTQPFNRHVQYGLSFIKLHIAENEMPKVDLAPKALVPENFINRKSSMETKIEGDQMNSASKPKLFAKIALREDSPDSESESSTALFNRWKSSRNADNQPTAAASIRQASTTLGLQKLTQSSKKAIPISGNTNGATEFKEPKMLDRNRNDLLFGEEEDKNENEKLERLSKHIEAEKMRLKIETEGLIKKKEKKEEKASQIVKQTFNSEKHSKIKESPKAINQSSKSDNEFKTKEQTDKPATSPSVATLSRKRMSSPNQRPTKKLRPIDAVEYRPFNQLLRGVVLVISGIQNPDRANLRSKALAMGAKYKGDWDPGCTHLICAFKNTPKYNQVKGKGKIVSRSWIEKCFNLKKYLPWRRYALDEEDQAKSESDREVLDETLKPAINNESDDECTVSHQDSKKDLSHLNIENKSFVIESGSDTDDEIQRVLQKNNKKAAKTFDDRNIFELTTEEEDFGQFKTNDKNISLNFFKDLKFFIARDLGKSVKQQVESFIMKFGGILSQNLTEADYCIGEENSENDVKLFAGEFVQPQWIFECNDMEKKIATQSYLISRT